MVGGQFRPSSRRVCSVVVCCLKQKTAYEIEYGRVGSEMCIRDREILGEMKALDEESADILNSILELI